ncbi:TraR/DksA family transcriptional regulator [Streptomyces endophyticus]|uniref:TraR/DksA C4-type zinc finger protein n=1 Tax=Streptomyces endophyticus TaxID=714166 RepID=A0ABU6FDJ7_9ACTN|nr:TraR/DksA C4-type zinc finger protein [Streptomyces endophyticus]MEB8342110.1 TraR/DksA C4-type zinc finger protein [Streptomyces endophyticus]
MVNHQTISDHTARLSLQDLAALRDNLQEQRRFREDQLRRLAAAASRTGRPLQQHSPARTQVDHTLAACARMVLTDVEAALDRIAEGRYGHCHRCRRTIDRDRLMIVPQARYCARCPHVPEAGP